MFTKQGQINACFDMSIIFRVKHDFTCSLCQIIKIGSKRVLSSTQVEL